MKRYESYRKETSNRPSNHTSKQGESSPTMDEFENDLQRSSTLRSILSHVQSMHAKYVQSAPQVLDMSTKHVFRRSASHLLAELAQYKIPSPSMQSESEKQPTYDELLDVNFFPPRRLSDDHFFDLPDLPPNNGSLLLDVEKASLEECSRDPELPVSLNSDGKPCNRIRVDTETLFHLLYSFLPENPQIEPFSLPLRCADGCGVHIGHPIRQSKLRTEVAMRVAFEKLLRKKRASSERGITTDMKLGKCIVQVDRTDAREYILVKLEHLNVSRDDSPDNPINFTFTSLSHEELCIMRLASEWYPIVRCVRIHVRTLSVIAVQTFHSDPENTNSFQCVFGEDPLPDAGQRKYLYTCVHDLFTAVDGWTREMRAGQYVLDFDRQDFTLYKQLTPGSVNAEELTISRLLDRTPAQSIPRLPIHGKRAKIDRPWWSWGAMPSAGQPTNRKRRSRENTAEANGETSAFSTLVFVRRRGNNLDVLGHVPRGH